MFKKKGRLVLIPGRGSAVQPVLLCDAGSRGMTGRLTRRLKGRQRRAEGSGMLVLLLPQLHTKGSTSTSWGTERRPQGRSDRWTPSSSNGSSSIDEVCFYVVVDV